MSKGRIPKPDDERAGHRTGVGGGEQIEVLPVDAKLIGVSPPGDLSPLASEVWRICVADMAELGHLREPDLVPLRNYCVEAAIAIECEATIAEFGAVMKEPITAWDTEIRELVLVGHRLKANPAAKLHREAANAVRLMAGELGLMPLARIRSNLMAAVTASTALTIKQSLEAEEKAAEQAARTTARRAKASASSKKPTGTTKTAASKRKPASTTKASSDKKAPAKSPARRAKQSRGA